MQIDYIPDVLAMIAITPVFCNETLDGKIEAAELVKFQMYTWLMHL